MIIYVCNSVALVGWKHGEKAHLCTPLSLETCDRTWAHTPFKIFTPCLTRPPRRLQEIAQTEMSPLTAVLVRN